LDGRLDNARLTMGGKKKTNASKAAKTAARRGRYAPEGGGTLRKGRKRMDAVLAGLPSRKRRLLVSAGAAATLALIALIILFSVRACGARGPSGDLVLSISLSDPDAAALGTVLGRFRSLYPEISVSMRNTDSPSADAADVLIGPAHAFSAITEDSPVPPPVPWSGPVWVLAARSEILDSAAKSLPDQVAALRADRASPSDFKAVLQAVAELGVAPITLGNSHRWPYLLWIQHWAAATAGPAAANRIPPPNDGSDADLYAALRPAFSELAEWRGSGWFEPSAWNEGWLKDSCPWLPAARRSRSSRPST